MKLYTRAFSRATLIPGQNYIAKASRSGRWVHGQDRCVAAASTRKGLARAADVSLGEFSSRSFISWCTFWRCWPPTTRLLCMLVWSRSLNEEPNTDSLSPVGVLAFLYPSFSLEFPGGKKNPCRRPSRYCSTEPGINASPSLCKSLYQITNHTQSNRPSSSSGSRLELLGSLLGRRRCGCRVFLQPWDAS